MEEMLLFGNILHDPKPPRKYRKRLLTLDDLTDKELRARYRFGRNSIIRITDIVRKDIEHPTQRSQSLSAEMQVLVALRFFACGGFLQVVGDTQGIDKSTVSRCVQKVSDALNAKADQFIKWPSVQRKGDIKQGFFDNGGFPGVVGCIDGTHVRISAPSHDKPSFVNRKGYHSINTQAICDHEGKFTNVVARWPGSVHDSHIMRCSQVCTHLEESHLSVQDGLILGDSGYACRSFLMTPYLRPTEPCHEKFNKAHMKTRCCIERTFGWWKKRFNCLHQGIRMHPEKVCKIIMACAVLHNSAIEMKEPMDEYDNEIVNNDDLNIVFRGPDEGRIVRDHIARGFFS
ncbi:putative nuclease HARBI1 [Mytilus edulis]|uniref:putative nuclease HARBI1 n=1 Tax=Mytilus edulis TaxID=6550 RepID=UPI0039EF7393